MSPAPAATRRLVLVLGGARSGKSRHAERLIEAQSPPYAYIATAQALDSEMTQRIAVHRDRRDGRWHSYDAPFDAAAQLDAHPSHQPVLLDCLTLWLTNHLLADADLEAVTAELCDAIARREGLTVVVSNEVGLGIVPDNALARRFRDAAGRLNQKVAQAADEVIFMVAGLPMVVKSSGF